MFNHMHMRIISLIKSNLAAALAVGFSGLLLGVAPAGAIGYPGFIVEGTNSTDSEEMEDFSQLFSFQELFFAQNEDELEGDDPSGGFKELFTAELRGSEEVPPVTTTMFGDAKLRVPQDERGIIYALNVHNANDVIAAHIHCAAPGAEGPPIVNLFIPDAPVDIEGRLAAGAIQADDILPAASTCNPSIGSLAALTQAMRDGQLYVNVHTSANPDGEIRGQIEMKSSDGIGGPPFATSTDIAIREVEDDIPGARTFVITVRESLLNQLRGLVPQLKNLLESFGF